MTLGFSSRRGRTASLLLGGTALAALLALGTALVSQHAFDMQPCPWCVLQRLIFAVIAVVCAAGWAVRRAAFQRVAAGLALVLAACGMAAALWQHYKAAASASCNLTLADKIVSGALQLDSLLPEVFAVRANCAEAAVNLLGVSYDFWSLALFMAIAAAMVVAVQRAGGR